MRRQNERRAVASNEPHSVRETETDIPQKQLYSLDEGLFSTVSGLLTLLCMATCDILRQF